ncbi:hypothetical protein ACFPOD_04500 [Nitratireductor kimnyeongensis]|uniref:Uncharacterized protein n=1 Tax=Nitratireductor kimnyeongensis TaxID=430679 RepID=A0ABW0T5H1_9HYPH|nr:hypothetical protein [Nitratireductor kimnyeongensis]QZZ34649.1 hypothetical protein KW403_12695 [Nitratireductor kimnyeongensis]
MALQNRVSPFGQLVATQARGAFTGNRGVLHDPDTKTLLRRRWTTKAWIICVCEFRGRRREVMGRNSPKGRAGWTELFFLDEVTALAAGHRPCFFCRREAAMDFLSSVREVMKDQALKAPDVDEILHGQRLAATGKTQPIAAETLRDLPDGSMIALAEQAYALRGGALYEWRSEGYGSALSPEIVPPVVQLLTPALTVSALRQGYSPVWHASIGS